MLLYLVTDSSGEVDPHASTDTSKQGEPAKQDAEKLKAPGLSLQDVSKLRLARETQKRTHDSFEDALASRHIIHHHAWVEGWLMAIMETVKESVTNENYSIRSGQT